MLGKPGLGAASQIAGMHHAGGKKKGQEMVVITMVETDTVEIPINVYSFLLISSFCFDFFQFISCSPHSLM